MTGQALALDIGGGHVTAALVDLDLREVRPGVIRRGVDPAAPAGTILDTWAWAALAALSDGTTPRRVGVAVPGPFEYPAGVSRMRHKFAALDGTDVRRDLELRWAGTSLEGLSIRFGNDADLFALGEWWGGAARGWDRVIGVTLGTGLGSGFVAEGRTVTHGRDVPPGGELWNTGYRGEVAEDFASGRAVTKFYRSRSGQERSAAEVAVLAESGDPDALAAYAELGAHLGGVLAPWAGSFRPGCLVVGGNVSRAWAHFRDELGAALPGVSCRPTTNFEVSALLGAASLG